MKTNIIYNENCIGEKGMKILPDNSIDLVVTDPPYLFPLGQFRPKARISQKSFGDFSIYQTFFRQFITELLRIGKPNLCLYLFCNEDFYSVLYPILYENFYATKLLIWDKQKIGMGGIWRRQFELILFSYLLPQKQKSGDSDIIRCKTITKGRLLFSQKPIKLIEKLILKSSNEGEVIIDPFMGSGSTAVACARLNRHYIGFEIDKERCQIIEQYLEAEKTLWDINKEELN